MAGLILAVCVGVFLVTNGVQGKESNFSLPSLQVHPLPSFLAQWEDAQHQGDYFDQVQPTSAGYLIWSEFPVKVYLDRPVTQDNSASSRSFVQWVEMVQQAITEWNVYLPLEVVERQELADIIIQRKNPPLGSRINPETGKIEIPRAKTAQASYEFYLTEDQPPVLRHRMIIQISPNLGGDAILAASRHELGHGLGIWGHSPRETDALYFSQVSYSPSISVRDVNTLKKIYQQPTRLGWILSVN